jgi:hypothetical protein
VSRVTCSLFVGGWLGGFGAQDGEGLCLGNSRRFREAGASTVGAAGTKREERGLCLLVLVPGKDESEIGA